MSGHFFSSALRNLWRNKTNALINIASLMLGLTVFSFAFLYVRHELSYDQAWPEAERIHRVIVEQRGLPGSTDGEYSLLVTRAYQPLLENFSAEIDKASRFYNLVVKLPDSETDLFDGMAAVDADFASIFRPEIVSGSLESVLQGPGFIALEETVAAAFPQAAKVGSRITLQGGLTNDPREVEYEVGAIYRLPEAISPQVSFRMITLMHDYSLQFFAQKTPNTAWNRSVGIWLTLKPDVDLKALHARLPEYVDSVVTGYDQNLPAGDSISNHLSYRFQPVTDMHFHPVGTEAVSRPGGLDQVLTIAAIGILVLLVGCSNSISLSLASVLERRRDIGIHKAVGALRGDILKQFLGEAALLALLAAVPAFALVEALLPVLKSLLQLPQNLQVAAADFAALGAIALVVGIASGAYPALMLADVKPQQVLKSGGSGNRRATHRLRTLLVGFQFCFAVMLLVITMALFLQLRVVRDQPLGFNPHNLVYVAPANGNMREHSAAIRQELGKIAGVIAVTDMANPPNLHMPLTINAANYINRNGELSEASIQHFHGGTEALAMLQIPLLAGRMFNPEFDVIDAATGRFADAGADSAAENRLILTNAAVKALGFASPQAAVDQFIFSRINDREGKLREFPARIIGVVEDSMYASLRRRPGPQAYAFVEGVGNFLLQYDDSAAASIEQEIQQVLQTVTGLPASYIQFVETQLAAEYTVENNQGRILLYCAGLAMFLSCIGLYGLAAFTMQRNVKEVGVRKVMGATVLALTSLYLWRYIKPVLVAIVLASPLAAYFVLQWIQRFPYQLEKQWLLPLSIAAGVIVWLIAMLTVAGIVVRAARARPVESLRYE